MWVSVCPFLRPESSQFPYLYGKFSMNPKYSPDTDFDWEIWYPGNQGIGKQGLSVHTRWIIKGYKTFVIDFNLPFPVLSFHSLPFVLLIILRLLTCSYSFHFSFFSYFSSSLMCKSWKKILYKLDMELGKSRVKQVREMKDTRARCYVFPPSLSLPSGWRLSQIRKLLSF